MIIGDINCWIETAVHDQVIGKYEDEVRNIRSTEV